MLASLAVCASSPQNLPQHQTFQSNDQYVAWELRRIQRRAFAYIHAKTPQQHNALLALIETQNAERHAAIEQRHTLRTRGEVIPFDLISRTYNLSPIEEDLFWVALSPHLCIHTHKLLLQAQSLPHNQDLTLGFIADLICPQNALFCARFWLNPDARLASVGLIDLSPPSSHAAPSSLLHTPLLVPHFVASACLGSLSIDPRLSSFCDLTIPSVNFSDVILPPTTQHHLNLLLASFLPQRPRLSSIHAHQVLKNPSFSMIISGPSGVGKTLLADALCTAHKKIKITIDCKQILAASSPQPIAARLSLALQNASFCDAALHLVSPEALLLSHPSLSQPLHRWLSNTSNALLILETPCAQTLLPLLDFPPHCSLHLPPPDAATRIALWESLLPLDIEPQEDLELAHVASTYPLTGHQIKRAIEAALSRALTHNRPRLLCSADLCFGASLQIQTQSDHPNTLPTSPTSLTLRDIILPSPTRLELEALLAACRNRSTLMHAWGFHQKLATGRGITALMHGEPGTGKTLSAEILAKEAGMGLIIVSIPNIVSKWLGETEKQLHNLFAQAQAQNAILFFDEADSLFSKRVNVERGQDHYQNMSINHLLQEVERFDGVLLLSTNLENNMDPAFARRILFKINFPMPSAEQREAIWRTLIPAQTPCEDLDFKELARHFELSGGYIKNAIVRAAYQCAGKGGALSQSALAAAAYEQCRAAGKLSRAPL